MNTYADSSYKKKMLRLNMCYMFCVQRYSTHLCSSLLIIRHTLVWVNGHLLGWFGFTSISVPFLSWFYKKASLNQPHTAPLWCHNTVNTSSSSSSLRCLKKQSHHYLLTRVWLIKRNLSKAAATFTLGGGRSPDLGGCSDGRSQCRLPLKAFLTASN